MPRYVIVRRCALALLCSLAAACGGRRAPAPAPQPADSVVPLPDIATEAVSARGIVSLFLAAEAQGAEAADTMLASGADFLMTGVRVTTRPRLAGLNGQGQAELEEASMAIAGNFAWVVALYRFTGRTPELTERARATFILEKQRAGWKIRHVHSSMVTRW